MSKAFTILALLGMITTSKAAKSKESCPGVKECTVKYEYLKEFRYFAHANPEIKELFRVWWEANKPDSDDDNNSDDGDNSDGDVPEGERPDESHLPIYIQNSIDHSKYINQCDGSINRLIAEGEKRIPVPSGQQFTDLTFNKSRLEYKGKQEVYPAKRIVDKNQSPSLYGSKGVRPAAIHQGYLGDCWLLAAIAALGEHPNRIKELFTNQNGYSNNNQHVVGMWSYGKKYRVHIDDYLTAKDNGHFKFAEKSPNGAWWGPLAEKAGAKYYGDYQVMTGGWMDAAFAAFTGDTSYMIRGNNLSADDIWKRVEEADKKHYIMTAGIGSSDSVGTRPCGLINSHAYTIIGAKVFRNQEVYIVRNPWGTSKYDGQLKDAHKNLSEAEKKELHHFHADDGKFLMTKNEVKTIFKDISVTTYDAWKSTSFDAVWDRTESFNQPKYRWEITNTKQQKVKIGMAAAQNRMFSCDHDKKADAMLFRVYKKEVNGSLKEMTDSQNRKYEFMTGGAANSALIFDDLEAGSYIIRTTQSVRTSKKGKFPFAITAAGVSVAPTIKHFGDQ